MAIAEVTSKIDQTENTVINLNDLIVGRTIESPIYDENGLLLLAGGSQITSEIKQALRQRGSGRVVVNNDDLKRITINQQLVDQDLQKFVVDSEMARKIDTIVDGGLISVRNDGPAVKDEIVFLGRKGYDQKQRERLLETHQENGQALGGMISEALSGVPTDGSVVAHMAANYLNEMTTDTDNVLTSMIGELKSNDVASRSLEVAILAMAIGVEMDLDAENSRHLAMAGLVHDWGMMHVPAEVRDAPQPRSLTQQLEIKKHPIHTLELLQRVSSLPRVISVISYQVHECINGNGYPRGRCGQSIHPFARILQVADKFVELTSSDRNRPPLMRYAAMEYLVRKAREQTVDPEVVRALLKIQSLFPIGSFVLLSDGTIAQVLRRNQDYYTEPIVIRVQDAEGNLVDQEADENLIDLHHEADLSVVQALPTPGSDECETLDPQYQDDL